MPEACGRAVTRDLAQGVPGPAAWLLPTAPLHLCHIPEHRLHNPTYLQCPKQARPAARSPWAWLGPRPKMVEGELQEDFYVVKYVDYYSRVVSTWSADLRIEAGSSSIPKGVTPPLRAVPCRSRSSARTGTVHALSWPSPTRSC